ncbi:MAG: hypothetical protein KA986_05585, partial [Aliarcobacter sp.]|nr:hypothetical protein [Aliarcobacter sp.]
LLTLFLLEYHDRFHNEYHLLPLYYKVLTKFFLEKSFYQDLLEKSLFYNCCFLLATWEHLGKMRQRNLKIA